MPLHLLGKKSWNVYNPANVERVQRDEAEARKREQEEERRQRQDEASDRIAILRGERDHTLHESTNGNPPTSDSKRYSDLDSSSRHRALKTRKLPGEDDTDRDIRLAQAQAQAETPQRGPSSSLSQRHLMGSSKPDKSQDHSITDADGHISLIPNHAQSDQHQHQHKKQKTDENPAHFYLSEAAGYGSKAGDVPWYSTGNRDPSSTMTAAKEPWGSTSPRRRERQAARLSSNDPLAAMKRGVKQLRDSERRRKEWKEQRERDLGEVEELARRREERKRRKRAREANDAEQRNPTRTSHEHGRQLEVESRSKSRSAGEFEADDSDDANSLDGFDLDQGYAKPPEKERQSRHDGDGHRPRHHHHHHRHRHHDHSHHSHHHHHRRHRPRSPIRE